MQLYGSGFNSASVVQWNGTALATTFIDNYDLTATIPASDVQALGNNSVTVYNAPPGGGLSAPPIFSVYLPLATNDLVYNPVTQLLYASVPSSAGPPLGNSIVSIDPATGALGTPIWVGSEPTKLALSSDGTVLWVGLNGAGAVRKVDLTTMQPGVQFNLGGVTGIYDPPSVASALSVMPGSPNTVVVSAGQSFYGSTTAIYDNGVPRTNTSNVPFNGLAFSPTGNEIYGAANESGYYVMTVDATGITSATLKNGASSTDIRYDSGRVYLTNAQVLDAEQGTLLGTFYVGQSQPAYGPVVPDSTIGRAWILNQQLRFPVGHRSLRSLDLRPQGQHRREREWRSILIARTLGAGWTGISDKLPGFSDRLSVYPDFAAGARPFPDVGGCRCASDWAKLRAQLGPSSAIRLLSPTMAPILPVRLC